MNENRNMILALVLSAAILAGYFYFFAPEPPAPQTAPSPSATAESALDGPTPADRAQTASNVRPVPPEAPRVAIETPAVTGSLNLAGARIDDLKLKRYRETLEEGSDVVRLLAPGREQGGYFAAFGWTSADPALRKDLPGLNAVWTAPEGARLTPETPVTLSFDAGGVRFTRTVTIDEDYLITFVDRVENGSGRAVALNAFGVVDRFGVPEDLENFLILHEGPIGYFDQGLEQWKYKKLEDGGLDLRTNSGWLGITDKYWLTALIPSTARPFEAAFERLPRPGAPDAYSTRFLADAYELNPGESLEITQRMFAGAKRVELIDDYAQTYDVPRFDLAVDWGNFWFLTKPFFTALSFFAGLLGDFGLAILAVTVLVRLAFFPLANKAFVSFAKMRKLQPKLKALQERHKDDRAKLQQEMMKLYKDEKVNPLAGCLPLLLQMPVFYAFYKVLFVTIEMRHTPFFGWIDDLSAPDPTAWINAFGLLPFSAEPLTSIPFLGVVFGIGAWPIIMGLTMWVQQQLNPPPTDPMQARIFAFLPIVFTFFFAQFAAGLVIYWAWTNLLSVAQQTVIMSRMGATPEIFKKIPFISARAKDAGEDA